MDKQLLDRLQSQCSKREYCKSDIYAKALKALEGDVEGAREILDSLVADRFVDDLRYASAFARDKSALSGWGPVKIAYALRAKKISAEDIAGALSEIDASKASEKLLKTLQAKARSLEGDPQIKLKLIKFALSRGYDYQEIEKLVREVLG